MDAYDALKAAARESGVPIYKIGRALDKPDSYVSSAVSRGSIPRCDNMALMAGVCDYSLALVPSDDIPKNAFVIDPREID